MNKPSTLWFNVYKLNNEFCVRVNGVKCLIEILRVSKRHFYRSISQQDNLDIYRIGDFKFNKEVIKNINTVRELRSNKKKYGIKYIKFYKHNY